MAKQLLERGNVLVKGKSLEILCEAFRKQDLSFVSLIQHQTLNGINYIHCFNTATQGLFFSSFFHPLNPPHPRPRTGFSREGMTHKPPGGVAGGGGGKSYTTK